tara:strand:- start:567 stop:1676 length:1110 start_codon:yes stop_codon:yes gene_type:complete
MADSIVGSLQSVTAGNGELARVEDTETSVTAPATPTSAPSLADVTLLLPDVLLVLVVQDHGDPESVLSMEATCKRYFRLLHDAPLWAPWTLSRFPVVRSILGAAVPPGVPDYRALYRMHWQLELRASAIEFETVDILYSAPLNATDSPPALTTSLEDYVLTVQILSFDDVLASTSCSASSLFIETEAGAPLPAVAKLRLPALWTKQTTPSFLAGQEEWSPEQMAAWDMTRMAARMLATRVSDLQPLLLYRGTQCAGSSNESYFNKTVLPSETDTHSYLAAAVHLTDDEGEVELAFLRTVPAQGSPTSDGEVGEPSGKYILESASLADVLFYFERSFDSAQSVESHLDSNTPDSNTPDSNTPDSKTGVVV